MRKIVTTTRIDATPDEVWRVLADFEAYPDWNPFVRSISGEGRVGAGLEVELAPAGRKPVEIRPRVTRWEPGRAFEWLGRMAVAGLFEGRHRFEVIPTDGGSRFEHSEMFTGILAGAILRFIGDATEQGFLAMNAALKTRVEASA